MVYTSQSILQGRGSIGQIADLIEANNGFNNSLQL